MKTSSLITFCLFCFYQIVFTQGACNTALNGTQFPGDCTRFYYCLSGNTYVLKCPINMLYDTPSRKCSWPAYAVCDGVNPNRTVSYALCSSLNYTRFGNGCSGFYYCFKNVLTITNCVSGFLFDETKKVCVNSSVAVCSHLKSTATTKLLSTISSKPPSTTTTKKIALTTTTSKSPSTTTTKALTPTTSKSQTITTTKALIPTTSKSPSTTTTKALSTTTTKALTTTTTKALTTTTTKALTTTTTKSVTKTTTAITTTTTEAPFDWCAFYEPYAVSCLNGGTCISDQPNAFIICQCPPGPTYLDEYCAL